MNLSKVKNSITLGFRRKYSLIDKALLTFFRVFIISLIVTGSFLSCAPKMSASVAQEWIGQPEKKLEVYLKTKGYTKVDDYYMHTQKLITPIEKSKEVRNRKTGEVHYTPPNGKDNFLMTTKYYIKNKTVVKWEITYSSIDQ